jgi:hypothetical protein
VQATLEDVLTGGPKTFDVRKPKALCMPVNVDGDAINEPLAHLMCYQVKPASGEPRHDGTQGLIETANVFGREELDTKKEDVLCVPALLDVTP